MNSREEAAVKAWDHYWGDRYGDEAMDEMGEEVAVALSAADAHDAAHGVHRVSLDDATVERAARALAEETFGSDSRWDEMDAESHDWIRHAARTVLAAAVGGDGE